MNRNSQVEERPTAPPVISERFTDLEELAALTRHVDMESVVLRPSPSLEASFVGIDLGEGAVLQVGAMTADHLTRAKIHVDRFVVSIPMRVSGTLTWNGRAVDRNSAAVYRPHAEVQIRASDHETIASLSLPRARYEPVLARSMGTDALTFPECCRYVALGDAVRDPLQGALERAVTVARQDPQALAPVEARKSLGESLLSLVGRALETLPRRTPDRERTLLGHSRVVGVAEDFMRDRLSLPLYVGDLCQATGVSERTLRSAFRNVYGVGPNRVLKLRRLVQVRHTLQRPSAETRVAEVATQHGFWDLGRFAGDYRRVFGESPSQTLRNGRPSLA
jgi:AraC family ethanolamine operon transcriptional activator